MKRTFKVTDENPLFCLCLSLDLVTMHEFIGPDEEKLIALGCDWVNFGRIPPISDPLQPVGRR